MTKKQKHCESKFRSDVIIANISMRELLEVDYVSIEVQDTSFLSVMVLHGTYLLEGPDQFLPMTRGNYTKYLS